MDNITAKFDLWKKASVAYYNKEAIMTDYEFDALEEELLNSNDVNIITFIKTHIVGDLNGETHFIKIDPITTESGQQVSLKKIKYKNITSVSEVVNFLGQSDVYYISPKFDGISIRISNIDNGIVITTRGGLDITQKLYDNDSIQKAIKKYPNNKYIVGELLITKDVFVEKYEGEFMNPRNFVAGCVNKKSDKTTIADLVFVPYSDGTNPLINETCWTKIDSLKTIDYPTYFSKLKTDDFPFQCDGVVIAYNTEKRELKDNYPLNMVAVKFPSETAITTVTGVEWTQKKSSKLTPIVQVEPTKLDGSIITKCSGYNYQYLIDNKIGIGAKVKITKSGDIIPVILETIVKSSNIPMPDVECIHIGKHLIVSKEDDKSRFAKFYNGLLRLNIKGIGENLSNIIGKFCNYDIVELFNPDNNINFACGLTQNQYYKVSEVYKIKTLTLADLIYMLQFDQVGDIISKKIENVLLKRSVDVSNIPQEVINNVMRGKGFEKIKTSMEKLKSYGVKIILTPLVSDDVITYEMTGEPTNMTKSEFADLLKRKYPYVEHRTLTKETKVLITNDITSNSNKMKTARKYNTYIITYDDALSKGLKH